MISAPFSGTFSAALFPTIASLSAMISIIICYYVAVKNGHQKPWPHCYISNTARHYPQFIYFRIGTISAAVFNILSYFLHYFWLESICRQSAFRLSKYHPKIFVILGTMATFYLFGSTATIDTGIMDMKLHIHCAGVFFILSILSILYNTIVCYFVYKNTKKITLLSISLKITLTGLLLFQLYLQFYKAAGFFARNNSDLSHILEYTLAFSVLGYTLLMGLDLKDWKLGYRTVNKIMKD